MVDQEFRIAAFLAEGKEHQFDYDNIDIAKVVNIVRNNKIPLLYLIKHPRCYKGITNSAEFRREAACQEMLHNKHLKTYVQIKNTFKKHNIRIVCFKSTGLFDYFGSDVDLLVDGNYRNEYLVLLQRMGFFSKVPKNLWEPFKDTFIRFYGDFNKSSVEVDLYQNITWYVNYCSAETLLDRSISSKEDEDLFILSPEDRTLLYIVNAVFQNKQFSLSDLLNIRKTLSTNNELDCDYLQTQIRDYGFMQGFVCGVNIICELERVIYDESTVEEKLGYFKSDLVSKAVISYYSMRDKYASTPFKMSTLMKILFLLLKIYKEKYSNLSEKFRSLLLLIKKNIVYNINKYNRRFFVVFSGIDGSGKSEMGKYIYSFFDSYKEIKKPRYVWVRIDSNELFVTNTIYKIFKPLIIHHHKLNEVPIEKKTTVLKKNPLARFAWIYLNTLEFIIKNNIYVRILLLLHYVIISDRYYYDAIVDITSQLPEANIHGKVVQWLLRTFSPKPDLVFYLDVDPKIAFGRKEHDTKKINFELLQKRIALYNRLFEDMNIDNLVRLNTNNSLNTVKQVINRKVLESYFGQL